jgi:hypothetical protein
LDAVFSWKFFVKQAMTTVFPLKRHFHELHRRGGIRLKEPIKWAFSRLEPLGMRALQASSKKSHFFHDYPLNEMVFMVFTI